MLAEDPDCPGSLGIAISEAIEDAVKGQATKYSLGSVLNHVCLHQTVIGQEAIKQMELAGEEPEVIIGCIGGGSNFAGMSFPFLERMITQKKSYRVVAVEPSSCASITRGELRMTLATPGDDTAPYDVHAGPQVHAPKIHAGGLRYHGMAPMVSHACKLGLANAVSYPQTRIFEAAVMFARTEGIVPAPEPAHAIAAVIDEALKCREEGRKRVILFNLCGHGMLDLAAYDTYLSGKMQD
jgi:tryptophan synthase beta chain